MKNLGAAFISLFDTKKAELDKKLNIHKNGVDNNYPELVETLIANSVTASQCANIMASYISGKGFGEDANKIIVNDKKGTTLLRFTQDIAESIAYHKGVFIQVNYNLNYEITTMDVLPFTDCRVGKKDGNDYSGKILVHPNWEKAKKDDARVVDVFNPKQSVLEQQIKKAGSIDKYNGQIFYFKFGKFTYPLSPIHPCLEDADSEKRAAIYKNTSLRKGFFGKTIVVTKPLVDHTLKGVDNKEYLEQVSERDEFRSTLKEFVGAENADGILHWESEFTSDGIEKEILFKNIESNIDDKLFEFTENSVSDNIRMCFNNVPGPLIRSKDGALFGQSGEAIKAMKEFYQEQTNDERMMVEEIVKTLMSKFVNKAENLTLIPLIDVNRQDGNSQAQGGL